MIDKNIIIRFFEKVTKTNNCWLWNGAKSNHYGTFRIYNKCIRAHIFSYIYHYKRSILNYKVCHKCNIKLCVNPQHLYLATQQQNVLDARRDGLSKAKLKVYQIPKINELLSKNVSCIEISKRYNVHRNTISDIKFRRTWTNI